MISLTVNVTATVSSTLTGLKNRRCPAEVGQGQGQGQGLGLVLVSPLRRLIRRAISPWRRIESASVLSLTCHRYAS